MHFGRKEERETASDSKENARKQKESRSKRKKGDVTHVTNIKVTIKEKSAKKIKVFLTNSKDVGMKESVTTSDPISIWYMDGNFSYLSFTRTCSTNGSSCIASTSCCSLHTCCTV